MNSRRQQVQQSGLGLSAETSARWLVRRSWESRVRRSLLLLPISSLIASVAARDAARFTAEFKMPEVSQVSTVPRGLSGKMQLKHEVSPGTTFIVAA